MDDVLVARAPAKLNLALSVGPPRADGLHPIASWMVTVDLHDDLTVTRLPADRLSRYAILWHADARRRSPIDWSIRSDLAVRAHRALEARAGRPLPVQLKLEKRIPVAAGLGGGSADAAAMLHAVNTLFDLGHSLEELADVAADLGSDVPFLVAGGSALVTGVGEAVAPQAELPDLHVVLVFPDLACPTGPIYGAFDGAAAALRPDAVAALVREGRIPDEPLNDLATPAMTLTPALAEARTAVADTTDAAVHLSGSGSTLFAPCDSAVHAEQLAAAIERALGLPAIPVRTTPGPTLAPGLS